jgi:cytochrome b subunit of formate dehydrogenase
MIKNRLIALVILAVLITGMVLFAVYRSPFGPLLTLAGVIAYFVFNKK